jgi:hypothetical protein
MIFPYFLGVLSVIATLGIIIVAWTIYYDRRRKP